jgi:hypothetical protein
VSHRIAKQCLGGLTEMEVVVLSIAERNQEANGVNERCAWSVSGSAWPWLVC